MTPQLLVRQRDEIHRLRMALEASWDKQTAHLGIEMSGNPALGQCYPTSRVVQHFFAETEVIKGTVWTGEAEEIHFWNALRMADVWHHIDLTWQQFPPGSGIRTFRSLDRTDFGDTQETVRRCRLLLFRVQRYLAITPRQARSPTSTSTRGTPAQRSPLVPQMAFCLVGQLARRFPS